VVVKMNIMIINKRHSKFEVRYSKTPNASYTGPLGVIWKKEHLSSKL